MPLLPEHKAILNGMVVTAIQQMYPFVVTDTTYVNTTWVDFANKSIAAVVFRIKCECF